MRKVPFVRAALIGLVGLLCTGCLEAGPRGYFENSVFGANVVDIDGITAGKPRQDRVVR